MCRVDQERFDPLFDDVGVLKLECISNCIQLDLRATGWLTIIQSTPPVFVCVCECESTQNREKRTFTHLCSTLLFPLLPSFLARCCHTLSSFSPPILVHTPNPNMMPPTKVKSSPMVRDKIAFKVILFPIGPLPLCCPLQVHSQTCWWAGAGCGWSFICGGRRGWLLVSRLQHANRGEGYLPCLLCPWGHRPVQRVARCVSWSIHFSCLMSLTNSKKSHFKSLLAGMKRNPAWIETFSVQFLGSVEVPYHQGNGILCAAMQKVINVENIYAHVCICSHQTHHFNANTFSAFRLQYRGNEQCTYVLPLCVNWRSACKELN